MDHSAADLDSNLFSNCVTDAQRQSVLSFAMGLEILRKERSLLQLLPQVVTLVKLILCVLPCKLIVPQQRRN